MKESQSSNNQNFIHVHAGKVPGFKREKKRKGVRGRGGWLWNGYGRFDWLYFFTKYYKFFSRYQHVLRILLCFRGFNRTIRIATDLLVMGLKKKLRVNES